MSKYYPCIVDAYALARGTFNCAQTEIHTGFEPSWVPARPIGFPTVWERLRATWLVFTGQADALVWQGQGFLYEPFADPRTKKNIRNGAK